MTIDPSTQIERFTKLAEVIESRPEQFDMKQWIQPTLEQREQTGLRRYISEMAQLARLELDMLAPHCGTTACVAGWAVSLWPGASDEASIDDAAQEILGISDYVASRLFSYEAPHQEAEQAAELLREMAEVVEQGDDLDDWFHDGRQS